ncbi:hypothetical protein [Pseudogemmobacter humi]|uniref:Uncharacterized protein n=1 Tax=Pseudogemmobacter humi TaxID=2483812 RepID=A0A3P5XIM4_9RHOB|nr:hypothetical protein [Pseudogemmobacter humi]VDC31430.1 hypothetical protein XINFAN_02888 [Pseudogemmobacter humi]
MNFTRRPVQYVGLRQSRCGQRYGVAPCMAAGGPYCYQTWGTCGDRDHIDAEGSITWMFCADGAAIMPLYLRDGEHIRTNALPLLVSATPSSSEINVGAQRSGISPLGVGSSVTLTFQDRPFDDHVGDPYRGLRPGRKDAPFWAFWRARNAFYTGALVSVWDGYHGQTLDQMQRRDYIVESVTGPDAGGSVTVTATDPLRLAEAKDAKFPPEIEARLVGDVDAAGLTIRVSAHAADLDKACGNTGERKFLRIGSEILRYTGHTLDGDGYRTLTGVQRGVLGSVAEEHKNDDAVSRIGRYENIQHWAVAADLIDNHTQIPPGYRDDAEWQEEGQNYMTTQKAGRTVVNPVAVEDLLGQLCQQGGFSIWWDERQQKIPLLANRPPDTVPVVLSDEASIVAGSAFLSDDVKAQISRVAVYFDARSPFDQGKPENYRLLRLHIDGYVEGPAAAGTARTLTVYADWITRETDALRLAARLLLRYRLVPQYLTLDLDSHDGSQRRMVNNGDVLDVVTGALIDSEGNPLSTRWQALAVDDTRPGHKIRLKLQSSRFIGRFAIIMAADAPDYAAASEAQRARGCWMALESTGRMPNGDEPYLLQ